MLFMLSEESLGVYSTFLWEQETTDIIGTAID